MINNSYIVETYLKGYLYSNVYIRKLELYCQTRQSIFQVQIPIAIILFSLDPWNNGIGKYFPNTLHYINEGSRDDLFMCVKSELKTDDGYMADIYPCRDICSHSVRQTSHEGYVFFIEKILQTKNCRDIFIDRYWKIFNNI